MSNNNATTPIIVVGLSLDPATLSSRAREALTRADALIGSGRQLHLATEALAHAGLSAPARTETLPSPLRPGVQRWGERANAGERLVVLASGDPMWHGIGATIAGVLGPERVRVFAAPSALTLACAALAWPAQGVRTVSLMRATHTEVAGELCAPGRALVLSRGADSPADVARVLCEAGQPDRVVSVAENLGGTGERVHTHTAAALLAGTESGEIRCAALNVVAIHDGGTGGPESAAPGQSVAAGLPEDAFAHDGQITKRVVRAAAAAYLRARPGQVMWDVGAGSGSVGIEFARLAPGGHVYAIEPKTERADAARSNAARLAPDQVTVVSASAPGALAGLPDPDAVFIGGGATTPGLVQACWEAVQRTGGVMVVAAVTLDTLVDLDPWIQAAGAARVSVRVEHAGSVGAFTMWRPANPVTLIVAAATPRTQ